MSDPAAIATAAIVDRWSPKRTAEAERVAAAVLDALREKYLIVAKTEYREDVDAHVAERCERIRAKIENAWRTCFVLDDVLALIDEEAEL